MSTKTMMVKEFRIKHMLCHVCGGKLDVPAEALHNRCDFCKKFYHDECMNIIEVQKVMDTEMQLWQCSLCFAGELSE